MQRLYYDNELIISYAINANQVGYVNSAGNTNTKTMQVIQAMNLK